MTKKLIFLDDSLDASYGHLDNYYKIDSKTGFDLNTLNQVSEAIKLLFK